MKEFQEKRKIRRVIFSLPVLILTAVLLIFLIISTSKIYKKSREASALNDEIKKELTELMKRKSELESNIAELQSESGIEDEIRRKFQVGKPGEEILVILDEDENSDNSKKNKDSGFFSRIWQGIKGIFK